MADYRRLKAWQLAQRLVVQIYDVSRDFPSEERYGLTGQMRRASVLVAANLAERCGRNSGAELRHFVGIARIAA